MAKAFVVIRNGVDVVDRVDSKQEAEARAIELRDANPRASFEYGKMDKRVFTTIVAATTQPGEEVY